MSSTEEGGGAVGAVSTDQTITNNNDFVSICIDLLRWKGELANLESLVKASNGTCNPLIRKVPSTLGRHEDFTHFVKKIGVDKHTLYNNMKTEWLEKCFDPKELEKYSNHNEKLAWMFFVDGCAIFQAVYMRYNLGHAIIRFINGTVKDPQSHQHFGVAGKTVFLTIFVDNKEPIHLLHLLRVRLLFKKEKPWHSRFCISFTNRRNHTRIKPHHSHPFRNVKELKNAGIWLEASETSCLTDISFNHYFFVGKLRLPPLTVDDSTMNLIAYEMCPDFYNNFTVTSYMGFLDSLIDEAEDWLIKKMNMDLVPSLMIYRHVKLQIHDHHNNMWIRYPAQVYRTFFRTRWTFFAFVGAIGALFIGALQAYYTIHQPK
uniref:Uncharacterized protein n=1 Tax=Gossypium raimondii TaxID=29730 RepID=A0A0D2SQ09_GOSRA|nr:hypothetical protein B456_007G354700 [Gossypium raimondii]